jgi:hypothetical protein
LKPPRHTNSSNAKCLLIASEILEHRRIAIVTNKQVQIATLLLSWTDHHSVSNVPTCLPWFAGTYTRGAWERWDLHQVLQRMQGIYIMRMYCDIHTYQYMCFNSCVWLQQSNHAQHACLSPAAPTLSCLESACLAAGARTMALANTVVP